MARTIDYLTCMVDVTPYEHEGHNYDALNIIVAYRKGQGFCITWQPVKRTDMGYMTGPMPSSDPLVGGKGFVAKAANRNNVKELEQIRANLLTGKEGIRFFFDQRNYNGLKEFMGDVANYGYTYDAEKQLKETIDRFNAMSNVNKEKAQEADLSPMMKQFYDIKAKHPERLLLFRCGDFYEAYEDDAMECVRILGISLAKEKANGHPYDMAGFPYHALDAYLPRLIRAGKRVAICDQLEDPKLTKNLVKRGITEMVIPNDQTTNPLNDQTTNPLNDQTTNTPNNQTTMKLNIKNNNQESANRVSSESKVENFSNSAESRTRKATANVANNAQVSNHEPLTVNREPSVNPEPEVEDAVIIEEQPTAQSQKPKAKKPTAQSQQYSVITYTTKKGGTACYLAGFKTEAEAKAMADQLPHSISNSYRYNDKGEKVFVVSFGTRYVDAASSMCEALNAGKKTDLHAAIAKCHEIYNGAVAAGKAEREKKTQERKAERAKAKADELAKVKKANGLYSMEDIADMMKRVLAGEEVPELAAVKEALKVA